MNIFDPTMTVPTDVAQAADKVGAYFEERGFAKWRLGGVASRSQLEQLEAQLAATCSENEAMSARLVLRLAELQHAVQARLAAEQQVAQLHHALINARDMLQTVADSGSNQAARYVRRMLREGNEIDATIMAAAKGGAA